MPGEHDMRAVLEAVVYGDDPRISPEARVQAARQLRELREATPATFHELLDELGPDEVIREADAYLGEEEAARLLAGDPDRPTLSAALQRAVEERAQQLLVAKLGDVEATITRRANELAAQLYREREFRLVQAQDAARAATSGHERGEQAPVQAPAPPAPEKPAQPVAPPPGLTLDDLWPPDRHRRRHRVRRLGER